MKRLFALALLATLIVCHSYHCSALEKPAEGKKPNFLVIYADDLGVGDLQCFGHPTTRTPELCKLAEEGLVMRQFYSAAPICSPSRASLVTGRLPPRNGVYSAHKYPIDLMFRVFYPVSKGGLPESEVTIASALKSSGYTSGLVGKWHLGHENSLPTRRGFDYFYGLPYSQDEGCPPYPCHAWQHIWHGVPLYENETIIQQPVNLPNLTARYTQKAMDFIDSNSEDPFFLYLAYDQTHVPLFSSPYFTNTTLRGLFGDALYEMDTSIGMIMDHLRKRGLEDNTFVLFTSDNGPWVDQKFDGGSAGLFRGQKGSTWEGGMREPAIAYWPGKIQPGTTEEVASTLDILPTLCKLSGSPLPADVVLDGHDMSNVIFSQGPSLTDAFFYWRDNTLQAVRKGPYKAHFVTREGFGEKPPKHHSPPLLYNVEADPGENWPLDPKQFSNVINDLVDVAEKHKDGMVYGPAQLDPLDWKHQPCCDPEASVDPKDVEGYKKKCYCDNAGPMEPLRPREDQPTSMDTAALFGDSEVIF